MRLCIDMKRGRGRDTHGKNDGYHYMEHRVGDLIVSRSLIDKFIVEGVMYNKIR